MGLIGIPAIISPDLLHTLCSMGHGDEIVFADVHFPTSRMCRSGPKEIRMDGHKIPELLRAVLTLMPLDRYDSKPISLMDLEPIDRHKTDLIWTEYYKIINELNPEILKGEELSNLKMRKGICYLPRFNFYLQSQAAFAIVHTGETAQYGNIILKKGIVDYI